MSKTIKRALSLFLVICLLFPLFPPLPLPAYAESQTLSISNGYIETVVSTQNGGFVIRTEEGSVFTKDDNNKDLLYRSAAFDTSFASFQVTEGGETKEYIFGNDYSYLGLDTSLAVSRTARDIRAVWSVGNLIVTQILEPVMGMDSHQHGTVRVSYVVENTSTNPVEVKGRLLLDTALGEQDYAYYELAQPGFPGGFRWVEQELVLSTANGDYLPANFFAYDNFHNPTIAAFTARDESLEAATPYKVAFGHWNNLASTIFEFVPDPDLTFTNRFNRAYLTADSAFAMYYDLEEIPAGEQSRTMSTYYGVDSGVRVRESDKVGITVTSPPSLRLSTDRTSYEGIQSGLDDGRFEIVVNATNLRRDEADTLPRIAIAILVDDGLIPLDEGGGVFTPAPTNSSPHFVEIGNLAVGGLRQLTFQLKADVLPATTYRRVVFRAYDLSATDSELLLLENMIGSVTTYILCPGGESDLPPVTFTSAEPQAIFNEGTRHLFLTGTGFDRFNLHSYYELRAYLKSDRQIYFTIPQSGIFFPEMGVAQITFTEPMPLGEYELVFEWSEWPFADEEPVLSLTAPALSFIVSGDPIYRNNTYGIVAVTKQGSMPGVTYAIREFADEAEYKAFQGNTLLVFRGDFASTDDGYYAVTRSKADRVTINGTLDFEQGNLHIFRSGDSILVHLDGDLYTTNSRTTVWKGAAELTPLTDGYDFGLIQYDERGVRITAGGRQPENIISLVWSGAYGLLQSIGGLAVDLRYGQFGAMYKGSGNTDFTGYVISFGGKLDLSFLMPKGPKQAQELDRQEQSKHNTSSTTSTSGGVVKKDVTHSPSDAAKAENEKNKVKPVGSVNIEDILFGKNRGYLGFNSRVELMLPKYVEPLPAMGGTLSINTIGGYDVGVKGITKTQKFDLEFELRVKNKPGSNIPIPDKIYFFMGGFEPGVNVDSAGAFWITGLGGGVDRLYDTIFSRGGLPPLTLLLTAEYDIVKVLSGTSDLALSLQGFRMTMRDIKFKNSSVVVINRGQLAVEWSPQFYLHLSAFLNLYDIIDGTAYMVVDGDFFEMFTRATVKVPDDVSVVGGMTVGGVDLGGNNHKLWGTLSALGVKLGMTYYWGGSTVHFGSGGKTAQPTYPHLLGIADIPIANNEETGETLYLRVGTNMWMAAEAEIVDEAAPEGFVLLSAGSTLTSNLVKTNHTLNQGHDTGDPIAISLRFSGGDGPSTIAEALSSVNVTRPDNSSYPLVFYDGTNIDSANANLVVDQNTGISTISFTILEHMEGVWHITTAEAADIVLYVIEALPEVKSLAAVHSPSGTGSLDLTWTGTLLREAKYSFFVTQDIGGVEDAGDLGVLIGSFIGADDDGENGDITISTSFALPATLPGGTYFVRMIMSKEDEVNDISIARYDDEVFSFVHANSLEPGQPGDVTLENRGDHMLEVLIGTEPVGDFDGYVIKLFERTSEGLVPTVFSDLVFLRDGDKFPPLLVGGTYYTSEGDAFGLVAEREYEAEVTAFVIFDNGSSEDPSDDLLILGQSQLSSPETLRAPSIPAISFAPQPGTFSVLQESFAINGDTVETYDVVTFKTNEVGFTLESDIPVSGYWSVTGILSQDAEDLEGASFHEVDNITQVNVNATLVDGDHTITFIGTTEQGDSFSYSHAFAVHTRPPTLLISSPVNGGFFAEDGSLLIQGIGDSDTRYTFLVNGLPVISNADLAVNVDGVFEHVLQLYPGVCTHEVSVVAVSPVGNSVTHTAVVRNRGLTNVAKLSVLAGDTVMNDQNITLLPSQNTTLMMKLLASGERDGEPFHFVINDERLVDWRVVVQEGSASIDFAGMLVVHPGSVGMAEGSLRVSDTVSRTAAVTFGAEIYRQHYLEMVSTVGGYVSYSGGTHMPGSTLTLTATPHPGYRFVEWTASSGGSFSDPTATTTVFTMPDGNTVVTARFSPIHTPPPLLPPEPWGPEPEEMSPPPPPDKPGTPVKPGDGPFTQGELVALSIPAELATANPDALVAYYLTDDGREVVILASHIIDGRMVFVAPENTTYYIKQNPVTFPDTPGHWATEPIAFTSARGIFAGVGNDRFDPDGEMTRAMFATLLSRVDGIVETDYGNDDLTDVPEGQWYYHTIAWAVEHGIVPPINGAQFAPDMPVTREQMAVMFDTYLTYRGIKLPVVNENLPPFEDHDSVSPFAAEAMERLRSYGMFGGHGGNLAVPHGHMTRAECAAMFQRLIKAMLTYELSARQN